MGTWYRALLTCALGGLTLLGITATASFGAIVLSDDFSDNNRLQTGALDANWYFNHNTSTLTTPSGVLEYGQGGTFRGITGTIPTPATLTNIGDTLQLSFDFRFTTSPSNQGGGFRFGLYNSNGTAAADNLGTDVTADATNNDYGYYFNLSTGTTQSHQLFRENSGTGGIMAGTDRTEIGTANTSLPGVADTAFHAGLLRLRLTSATTVEVLAQVDNNIYFNNFSTNSLTPTMSFNEVAFGSANNNLIMQFDNVVVSVTPVPEPSSLALAGLGLTAMAWGWRRRNARSACPRS